MWYSELMWLAKSVAIFFASLEQLEILEEVNAQLSEFAKEMIFHYQRTLFCTNSSERIIQCYHRIKTIYLVLVWVEVERSFSTYKTIATDRRTNLLESNIEKLLVIQFNSFFS